MKKNFEQPELMVVRMNNRDIVTESLTVDTSKYVDVQYGGDRFRDWED